MSTRLRVAILPVLAAGRGFGMGTGNKDEARGATVFREAKRLNRMGSLAHRWLTTLLGLALSVAAMAQNGPFRDPSKHKIQFVTVQADVRLEVLDWGGSGRPVVLLAGLGNSAHVFDDFAEHLSDFCHVYGITRRGYGTSDQPDSGYDEQRLADDVLAVLESLQLTAPVLMGHSIGGDELTAIGAQRSNRIAGLVYLDATADPRDDYTEFNSRIQQLPAAIRSLPEWSGGLRAGSVAGRSSFAAYRRWLRERNGVEWPEAELRNLYEANEDGSVGRYKTSKSTADAILAGGRIRDYSHIHVPILAFSWFPPSVAERMKKYPPTDAEGVAKVAAVREVELKLSRRRIRSLFSAGAPVHVIDMPGANHFLFISDEAFVLSEVRAFLKRLPLD